MDENKQELVTAYVTKWALTRGILKIEGELVQGGKYFSSRQAKYHIFVGPRDFHLDVASAHARVMEMVKAKKASLKKQLSKLEMLNGSFPVHTPATW
jgi:hypothetical protein